MGIVIDIVVIAILILNIIIGYKKGLINVVFNILAFFIAIIITFILYKPVSNFIINNTEIDDKIKQTIIENSKKEDNSDNEKTESSNIIQKYVEDSIKNAEEDAKEKTIELVANTISIRGVEILTGILLFIVTRLILIVLGFITKFVANLPLIKQFNEIGGVLYGLFKGLLIIYIILTIMFFVVSINQKGIISKTIENSYITKILYDNNIIVNYCILGKNLL